MAAEFNPDYLKESLFASKDKNSHFGDKKTNLRIATAPKSFRDMYCLSIHCLLLRIPTGPIVCAVRRPLLRYERVPRAKFFKIERKYRL